MEQINNRKGLYKRVKEKARENRPKKKKNIIYVKTVLRGSDSNHRLHCAGHEIGPDPPPPQVNIPNLRGF